MPPSAMTIRTVTTAAEYQAFFQTISLAYAPALGQGGADEFARWYDRLERRSTMIRTTLRGAFLDSICLGTYQIEERLLCMGPVRIPTGCIGYVATHPNFQRQGIATALMNDSITLAMQEGYPLLLLTGIHNFYKRFGFTNIIDASRQYVRLADITKKPASPYSVRAATEDDCGVLLELYQKHYNRFERSIALQEDHLRNRLPQNPPWLACDEQHQPQGYLLLRDGEPLARAQEVAANNWPATLALLHHHANLLQKATNPSEKLCWPRPFDTPSAYETADHLPVEWEIYWIDDGDWMAHVTNIPALVRLLEAIWHERWQRAGRIESGRVTQIIGDYAFTLAFGAQGLRLLAEAETTAPTLRLHPSTFTKLVFGWRPLAWAMNQPDSWLPQELVAIAEILYPMHRFWVPSSDYF